MAQSPKSREVYGSPKHIPEILERISDALIVLDKDWRCTYINKQAGEILGRPPETLVGKHFWSEFPEGIGQSAIRNFYKAIETQQPISLEDYFPLRDRLLETRIFPSSNGLLVFFADITERKRVEEQLRQSEEKFAKAFNTSPDAIFIADMKNERLLDANESFTRLTGYKRQETVGKTAPELGIWTSRDDYDRYMSMMREKGRAINLELKFRSRQGEERIGLLSGELIDLRGESYILSTIHDITERKQAEVMLQESEERYRALVEQAADGIFIADHQGNINETNTSALKMSGYSREELIRMNIMDLIHPEDLAATPFQFDDLRTGKVVINVRRMVCKDGSIKPIETTAKFLTDGRLQGVVRDITDRLRAQAEISDWKNRYDLVIAASGQLVYDYDLSTGAIVWGGDLQRVLGFSVGEMTGGIAQWKEMIHPEDRDGTLRERDISEKKLASYDKEYRFRHKNGSYRWMHDRGFFLPDETGKAGRMIGMMNDVSRRKVTERMNTLLAQTLKSTKDSISITELDDTIIFVNDAFLATYGYPEDELVGRKITLVRAPQVSPQVGERLYRETQIEGWHGELVNRRKDGSEFPIELWTSLVLDESGKPIATVGVARDITDRKHAEEEIFSSRERLRELAAHLQTIREEEDTRIAREIHDELGQTLTGLKIDIKWLEKRISKRQHAAHDKLMAMSNLIDTAIHTVRKVSTELRPGVLELGLTAAIDWQTREFQGRTGIQSTVSVDVQEDQIDEQQSTNIFRIFQEILTNIIRHAHATNVSILLRMENGFFILEVKDNGVGINEEEIRHTKSLGILGMRERALLLGGNLNIRGVRGKGTTVTVTIPIQQPVAA